MDRTSRCLQNTMIGIVYTFHSPLLPVNVPYNRIGFGRISLDQPISIVVFLLWPTLSLCTFEGHGQIHGISSVVRPTVAGHTYRHTPLDHQQPYTHPFLSQKGIDSCPLSAHSLPGKLISERLVCWSASRSGRSHNSSHWS